MPTPGTTILVTRNGMGVADPELQLKLVDTYFRLLEESDLLPAIICFYADGVRLVVKGSPVIDTLKSMEQKSVRLIVCRTCLEFYGLVDHLEVGIVGGMPDIIEAQKRAEKVFSI